MAIKTYERGNHYLAIMLFTQPQLCLAYTYLLFACAMIDYSLQGWLNLYIQIFKLD